MVAQKGGAAARPRPYPLPYIVWSRKDDVEGVRPWMTLDQVLSITAQEELRAEPINGSGSPLFTGTRGDTIAIRPFKGTCKYYLDRSHKGTTTDCSPVYWVKVLAHDATHSRSKIRSLTEDELGRANWEGVKKTSGKWIEAELLYPLIRGRDIGRFCHATDDWHIIVPNSHYENVLTEDEFKNSYAAAWEYFDRNRRRLKKRSTYKRYQSHLPFYVIYDVGPYSFSRFKVVWMEQQNPREFRATVISTSLTTLGTNKIIVPYHKLYMLSLDNENEAHYVCAVLNSRHMRRILGGFLVGKQIGTAIFRYTSVRPYDSSNRMHAELAAISKRAHRSRANARNTDDLAAEQQNRLDQLVLAIHG
jgi:hypothetical protein